ncbi:MAG TPA: VOC family protein [Acidimicrobiales bacterium]
MPIVPPPYHFGLVVADLEAAQQELADALHLRWAGTMRRSLTLESPDGPTPVEVAYCYSLEGPPYLELLEQRPGTIFDQVGLHHIGIWCDDFHVESERLEQLGWPRETVSLKPDGSWSAGLFHTGDCGLRLEVVNMATSGPALLRYLAGGDYRPDG